MSQYSVGTASITTFGFALKELSRAHFHCLLKHLLVALPDVVNIMYKSECLNVHLIIIANMFSIDTIMSFRMQRLRVNMKNFLRKLS